jgi:hypothetical protein
MRYLVLTYYTKPGGKTDESATVVKNIKNRDLQTANVILDFKTLSVLKCSMGGVQVPRDFNRIVEYYMKHYEATITRLFTENGYEIVKPEDAKLEVQPQPVDPIIPV